MIVDIINCEDYNAIYLNDKFYTYGEFYRFQDILELGVELGIKGATSVVKHEVDWDWLESKCKNNWPQNLMDVRTY